MSASREELKQRLEALYRRATTAERQLLEEKDLTKVLGEEVARRGTRALGLEAELEKLKEELKEERRASCKMEDEWAAERAASDKRIYALNVERVKLKEALQVAETQEKFLTERIHGTENSGGLVRALQDAQEALTSAQFEARERKREQIEKASRLRAEQVEAAKGTP